MVERLLALKLCSKKLTKLDQQLDKLNTQPQKRQVKCNVTNANGFP